MRNEDPLITVIIPIYNIMDCLERCVTGWRSGTGGSGCSIRKTAAPPLPGI